MKKASPAERTREISLEDLLGREPLTLDRKLAGDGIRDRVVMVTGAAGSIGSELCRQIAVCDPLALVGFDQAETPLFLLDRELKASFPGLAFHPQLGSTTRFEEMDRVLSRYRPSIVYHGAAYKHVAMMEENVFAAVENNIFGTWQAARASALQGVEYFVLISTDKAVRPASVMGATKRVAEIAIRSLQQEGGTRFISVRFGNVLGSNGSVLPIFQGQIAAGGPVTVTDAEMKRYFITANEASQSLLKSRALSTGGGETMILDMGEPIKILDLARRLISLSAEKPGGDVEIVFTGMRRGEKLVEELHLQSEFPVAAADAGIWRLISPEAADRGKVHSVLQAMRSAVDTHDERALILLLQEAVPEFTPASELLPGGAALLHG